MECEECSQFKKPEWAGGKAREAELSNSIGIPRELSEKINRLFLLYDI